MAAASSNTVEEEEDLEDNKSQTESPWPHLNAMFRCVKFDDKICKFICLLCMPRPKEVSAYSNSPSNLRKHVEVTIVDLW